MKITPYSLLFFLIIFSQFSIAQEMNNELEVHEDWRLKKDKDGIEIYTRWLESDDKSKARQMHAVMYLRESLSAVVETVSDPGQVLKWLNRVDTYYHFENGKSDYWHAYSRFGIPWPLEDQDLITENILTQDLETQAIHLEINGIKDYIEESKKAMRIPHFEGSWDFTPQSDGRLRVDYFVFVKAKPVLPRWIIDPVVEYGLWKTFSDFREVSAENGLKNRNLSHQKK